MRRMCKPIAHLFDFASKAWSEGQPAKDGTEDGAAPDRGRSSHSACVHLGKAIIFGGRTEPASSARQPEVRAVADYTSSVLVFDLAERRWHARQVMLLQPPLRTEGGRPVVLRASASASPLFYVQVIPLKWFLDRSTGRERRAAGLDAPHVVALGQCALGKGVLTVDALQRRAVWEQTT